MGLNLLHHKTAADEWYVDGIAVAEKMRGKGVGTELLGHLESLAEENGIRKISLEVINTNQKAQALYLCLGFVAGKRTALWPFNHLYGFPFDSVITMEKTLHDANTSLPPGKV